MRMTLTNTGTNSLPICSEDEGGWVVVLEPETPLDLDKPDSDVWIIGDKPGMLESIEQGLTAITHMAKALLTAMAGRHKGRQGTGPAEVRVTLHNRGEKAVWVIPGDTTKETTMMPLEELEVLAAGYIELRELGG